jgi:predicted O-methyltransferase YrrM
MQSSLRSPRVTRTLDRLHRNARIDLLKIALKAPFVVPDFLGFRKIDDDRLSHHMRSTYLPVTRTQGQMLYLMARSIDARRIVEFGTSFGISTLYLAAAVKDNGGGVVVGSELDASKHAKAIEHLREAELDAFTAVVLADNIFTFKKALRPYVEYVQSEQNGFVSSTLDISDGFELSVFMG